MIVPFASTIFYAYMYKIPYDFLKFNFRHFTVQVRLYFLQKRKLKIFGFENVEGGVRKILTCNFEKTQVPLG